MRKSSLLIFSGCLLIAAALGIFGMNQQQDELAGESSDKAVQTLVLTAEESRGAAPEAIPDYQLSPNMEMPSVSEDDVEYIGVLDIPSLGLHLPVASSWSYPNLKIAPCRYKGSIYDNNCIIAAHNYRSHFGKINTLSVGDSVSFTDVDGNVFNYEVSKFETLEKTDFEKMDGGEWDLTLFTCTYGGQNRVTVRCQRVSGQSPHA